MHSIFVIFLFSLALGAQCQLDEHRLVCKSKSVVIPTGEPIESEPIVLNFDGMEFQDEYKKIVDEECAKLRTTRARRSISNTIKTGSKLLKGFKKSKKLWKKAKPILKSASKTMKKPVKFAYQSGKFGAKMAVGGLGMIGGIKNALDDFEEVEEKVKGKFVRYFEESDSPENYPDTVEDQEAQMAKSSYKKSKLIRFRSNVRSLLQNEELEGIIQKSVLQQLPELENSSEPTDIHCDLDPFRFDIFSLKLKILSPELQEIVAQKCEDIGAHVALQNYSYYRLPSEFLVENDKKWLKLNESGCSESSDGAPICSELQEVECSPDTPDSCFLEHITLAPGRAYFRKLLIGAVYYGPAKTLKTWRRSEMVELPIEPFHLKYFRPLEGMRDFEEDNFIL